MKRMQRRRYPRISKSMKFVVRVFYKQFDSAFDEALRRFARMCAMGEGGSGYWTAGPRAHTRDIAFGCGSIEHAQQFLSAVRRRFKVTAKLEKEHHLLG